MWKCICRSVGVHVCTVCVCLHASARACVHCVCVCVCPLRACVCARVHHVCVARMHMTRATPQVVCPERSDSGAGEGVLVTIEAAFEKVGEQLAVAVVASQRTATCPRVGIAVN